MKLKLTRLQYDLTSTIGYMTIDNKFTNFTLEDTYRETKVMSRTRIPAGTYNIKLRNEGTMTKKYAAKYPFHKGMLWLQDVPNFEWVYIHTGNIHTHTDGCILVGDSCNSRSMEKSVGQSVLAYKDIYESIANAILSGEEVSIEIIDEVA